MNDVVEKTYISKNLAMPFRLHNDFCFPIIFHAKFCNAITTASKNSSESEVSFIFIEFSSMKQTLFFYVFNEVFAELFEIRHVCLRSDSILWESAEVPCREQ